MTKILIFGTIPKNNVTDLIKYKELILTRNLVEIRKRVAVEDYAMIIIDLEGREKKGMELAGFIRSIPRQCMTPILFLANNHKLEWDAFHNIHCYDFFIKPLSKQNVLNILYLFMQRTDGIKHGRTILFSVGSNHFPVNIDDILYLECINRDVIVHTTTAELNISAITLSDFMKANKKDFIQIRRSTVVNKSMIRCVNSSRAVVELKNSHEQLSIGKTFVPIIRQMFDGI